MAYQYFGDVVTFDTTYKTNKYDMPFGGEREREVDFFFFFFFGLEIGIEMY